VLLKHDIIGEMNKIVESNNSELLKQILESQSKLMTMIYEKKSTVKKEESRNNTRNNEIVYYNKESKSISPNFPISFSGTSNNDLLLKEKFEQPNEKQVESNLSFEECLNRIISTEENKSDVEKFLNLLEVQFKNIKEQIATSSNEESDAKQFAININNPIFKKIKPGAALHNLLNEAGFVKDKTYIFKLKIEKYNTFAESMETLEKAITEFQASSISK